MTKKTKKTEEREVAVQQTQTDPVLTPSTFDPFDRHDVADWLNRWPAWFARQWPEHLIGESNDIKVEEYMDDDELVVRAEMPGVDPDEGIDITVDNGRLTIRAEREERTEDTEAGYRSEFRYGSFVRMLTLPEGAEIDDISASYQDGILDVRVPLDKERSSRKTITVARR